jgi:hypothetical protein
MSISCKLVAKRFTAVALIQKKTALQMVAPFVLDID